MTTSGTFHRGRIWIPSFHPFLDVLRATTGRWVWIKIRFLPSSMSCYLELRKILNSVKAMAMLITQSTPRSMFVIPDNSTNIYILLCRFQIFELKFIYY